MGLPSKVAMCFMTMCVSALALTTLDTVARIGRMSWQELFSSEKNGKVHSNILNNKYFATIVTLVFGFLLSLGGYNNIWPLFGSANQLLGALVLIALSVFLKMTNRKGFMLWVPMFMMLTVTFTALVLAAYGIVKKLFVTGGFVFLTDGLQLIVALLLMVLAVMVAFHGFRKLFGKEKAEDPASVMAAAEE
jgi:carbon starvation protein